MRKTAAPIVMPVVAETCMGEAILGEVAASQMGGADGGGAHGGGPPAYVSCRECASCIAKCARSPPMMGATVMCKVAPADTEAAPSDTAEVHAPEAHAAEVHPSQAHATEPAPAKMHSPEASTAKMHAVTAEVAAPTKSSKPSRLSVRLMRYAAAHKPDSEPLDQFIKRNGGINACAARFSRRLGRGKAKGPRAG
jgi:hypothetical protein